VIAALELAARLGRYSHDAVTTMAVVLASVALLAYWILKA
jgi:hypothetical protein